jgi:hypothetical protein
MTIPTVMGCPLWRGRIKQRVAKKYLKDWRWPDRAFLTLMANVKVGDLIRDCSAFNVRVAEIEPRYCLVGKRGGNVLEDIDITNDKGGSCSFMRCGVAPAWTREDILRDWAEKVKYYEARGDEWDFAKRYEFTTVLEDGQAVVDSVGLKAKYGI